MSSKQGVVHVVSSGSYSDYSVLCACPSADDAEKVAAVLRGDSESWHQDATAEELPLVSGDGFGPVLVYSQSVEIWDNGITSDTRPYSRKEWPFHDQATVAVAWRWVRAPYHNGKGGRLNVWGTSQKRVAKVLTDRRAMLMTDAAMRATDELKGKR